MALSDSSRYFRRSCTNGVAPQDQLTFSRLISSTASSALKRSCSTQRPPVSIGVIRPWKNPVAWLSGEGIHTVSSGPSSRSLENTRSE